MRKLILASAITLAAMPALAADQVGQFYWTPQAGAISTDNDRLVQDKEWLYGLSLGRHFSNDWSGEFNFNKAQVLSSSIGAGDLRLRALSIDALRYFSRESRVSPYLTFGVGALENEPSLQKKNRDFMAQAGIGAQLKMWESETGSFSLRPEVKARWSDAGSTEYTDYVGTLGLQFSFGRAPVVAAAAPMPEPAPVVQAPPPPPPPPAPPADTDRDGVIDANDRCPGTVAGTLVDENGCPQRGSITLRGVNFELDSAMLTGDSRPLLAGLAADLKRYPRLRIEMQGHTDSSGSDAYNLTLSQQRADAVREFLVSEGVPAAQITSRGYGEGQPIASNTDAEGRAENRRVVMSVLDNPGNVEVDGEAKTQTN